MKTVLYMNFYFEKNEQRRLELEDVFEKNFKAGFEYIVIFCENKDARYVSEIIRFYTIHVNNAPQTYVIYIENRPFFQQYINDSKLYFPDWLISVCNSDIYIDAENLNKLKNLPWSDKKLFVALSRYDETKLGTKTLLDRPDSQDFWAWKSDCNVTGAQCPIGVPGSDNSIAWKFKEAGYEVINPSKDIVTCHLHNVHINNYRDEQGNVKADQICPPPYHLINPHHL